MRWGHSRASSRSHHVLGLFSSKPNQGTSLLAFSQGLGAIQRTQQLASLTQSALGEKALNSQTGLRQPLGQAVLQFPNRHLAPSYWFGVSIQNILPLWSRE